MNLSFGTEFELTGVQVTTADVLTDTGLQKGQVVELDRAVAVPFTGSTKVDLSQVIRPAAGTLSIDGWIVAECPSQRAKEMGYECEMKTERTSVELVPQSQEVVVKAVEVEVPAKWRSTNKRNKPRLLITYSQRFIVRSASRR